MQTKITIKDVAKAAGVSVATVSYVMNNRTDMRISDATRQKVLQIVNLLNYTPNPSAKTLASNRSHMIALYLTDEASTLKKAEQMHFIHFLSDFLYTKNYNLIYLTNSHTEKFDYADAILAYDVSSAYFRQIGNSNFVPLLALDCFLDDPLPIFFQVNSDYKRIHQEATNYFNGTPFTLLTLETPNLERRQLLSDIFCDVLYVSDFSHISDIIHKNIVVLDETLYRLLSHHSSLYYAPSICIQKLEVLFQALESAILRTPTDNHILFV